MQAEGLVAMVGWVEQLVNAAERHISVMQVRRRIHGYN